jgi:hypothetical protein
MAKQVNKFHDNRCGQNLDAEQNWVGPANDESEAKLQGGRSRGLMIPVSG